VTICPAGLGTDHDERVTARGKLLLGQALLEGDPHITAEEAQRAFLCMHCGGCTAVCQSHLDLEGAWNELEEKLHARVGRPDREIEGFVQHVQASGLMKEKLWYGR
jgi:Fe-S oxidoreductase